MERDYFTAQTTSMTITKSGALAIYCGDKPTKNSDGSTNYALRAPILLMPPFLFDDAEELMQKIAKILNEHAGEFFSSALPSSEEQQATTSSTSSV